MTLEAIQAVQTRVRAPVQPVLQIRLHQAPAHRAPRLQAARVAQQVHRAAVHPQTDLWIGVSLTRSLLHTLIEWAHCQI